MKKTPMGIYIHLPFCIKKCNYCDFLSFQTKEEEVFQYMETLKREMQTWGNIFGKETGNRKVETIYLGGGTPSSLEPIYIEEIMEQLNDRFLICHDAEITIECNPGTVNTEKLKRYKQAGINRISMGLQSAQETELKLLGRIHTYDEFLQAYQDCRKVGFSNISVDVMSGLPSQTLQSYHDTLERVLTLQPEHISSYSLIVEEDTVFSAWQQQGNLNLPEEDVERQMYYDTSRILAEHGYQRYEISNYAKKGYESRHNTSYWIGTDYLGLGLGAASYIDGIRFSNTRERSRYIDRRFEAETKETIINDYEEIEVLSKEEQMEEFMFLGLRMMQGISMKTFEMRFGIAYIDIYGERTNQLEQKGYLKVNKGRVSLTEKGIDISNQVLAEFLLD